MLEPYCRGRRSDGGGRHGGIFWLSSSLEDEAAMSVESPVYEVVRHDGPREIRRYGRYLTAGVTVRAESYNGAAYAAFGMLADYIFGNNTEAGTIPMTAPVSASRPSGAKIAMTAPATSERSRADALEEAPAFCTVNCAGEYVVRFTMPARFQRLAELPRPNDPRVRLEEAGERLVAVERLGGRLDDAMVTDAVGRIVQWAEELGFVADGEPEAAQYDAPWKPGFLRHNEVLIPVRSA